jgi:hypothetical protein
VPYPVAPRSATPNVIPAYQGSTTNTIIQLAAQPGASIANMFNSGTTLSSVVWEGQNQLTLASPAVAWFTNNGAQLGYDVGQVLISPAMGDVALLDPGGEYRVLIYGTTSGDQTVVADCLFKVLASPGFATIALPDLISYDLCLAQLSGVDLTPAQIDVLPRLITAASQAWRLECNDRYFDMRTLTESYLVSQDGYVRLRQEPVQIVTRVQGQPNQALTIYNNSTSVQTAQAYFTFTGYDGGYGSNAKTATGLYLNWVSNGTPANQTLLFSAYPTIGQMATAINAVGSGWTAQAIDDFDEWLCTELTGGFISQGCTALSSPTGQAQFNVLTDLDNCKLLPRTPMLYVGTQKGGNINAARWGPGGDSLWANDDTRELPEVKVTYQAGFNAIPQEIQNQVAQIVKWKLELGIQELMLEKENAAEYDYELAAEMVSNLPKPVRDAAGRWKPRYA